MAYCSAACRKAANRQEQAKAEPAKRYRCEYCGKAMKTDQRFCSDRCEYYGCGGILPRSRMELTAYDEGMFPTIPEGQIESYNQHQALQKPWRARVYGGKRAGREGNA